MTRIAALALAATMIAAAPAARAADNPLIGTVWSGTGEPASLETVEDVAIAADFVLIGEIHTNPVHHATQARLIEAMVKAGRQPAVVFEMVPKGLQGDLDAFLAADRRDAARLGERLQWEERGWPDWAIYQPVAEAALAAGLAMRAGDLDRDTIRAIGRGEERPEGGVAYPDAVRARLGAEIMAAHCDLMPEQAIPPMIAVQQARDLAMADALLAAGTDGAVLIAGGGHTRADWGVPFVLGAKAPDRTVLSIGQFEVTDEDTAFADYLDERQIALPYDYVIFTTKSDDTDHCAALREQMGK